MQHTISRLCDVHVCVFINYLRTILFKQLSDFQADTLQKCFSFPFRPLTFRIGLLLLEQKDYFLFHSLHNFLIC